MIGALDPDSHEQTDPLPREGPADRRMDRVDLSACPGRQASAERDSRFPQAGFDGSVPHAGQQCIHKTVMDLGNAARINARFPVNLFEQYLSVR